MYVGVFDICKGVFQKCFNRCSALFQQLPTLLLLIMSFAMSDGVG